MGFNKRFITKETIDRTKQEDLERLFSADALIMDIWSSKFREMYNQGLQKEEIIKILNDE